MSGAFLSAIALASAVAAAGQDQVESERRQQSKLNSGSAALSSADCSIHMSKLSRGSDEPCNIPRRCLLPGTRDSGRSLRSLHRLSSDARLPSVSHAALFQTGGGPP